MYCAFAMLREQRLGHIQGDFRHHGANEII